MPEITNYNLEEISRQVRIDILNMAYNTQTGHIGSSFSIVELLVVLYFETLNIDPDKPDKPDRDIFILSKGHAAPCLYVVLAHRNFITKETLKKFHHDGSILHGHVNHNAVPGIEVSSGSLGHGLPIACGLAHAKKKSNLPQMIYCLIGDGECNEGTTWEAAMYATQNKLDNLVAIVDYNKFQGFGHSHEVTAIHPLIEKWLSFGWSVYEINGHDLAEIKKTYNSVPKEKHKPTVIIAHTISGKGMSHIENTLDAHYYKPDETIYKKTLRELNAQ